MKRFILTSPVVIATFLMGVLAAYVHVFAPLVVPTKVSIAPKTFEVNLVALEANDLDKSKSMRDDRYLKLYDAEFFDEETILGLSSRDGMRISHDGGKTWPRMFVDSGGNPKETGGFTLQSLEFLDSKTGWAGGSALISTHDGGQTWQNIKLPEWMDNLRIKFLNKDLGYVAGRAGFCDRDYKHCDTSLTLYKTTNGGKTWKKSFRTRENTVPWDIVVLGENIAMMTTDGGWLYRTENGGKSWKTVIEKDYHHVMSISRSPDGRFWLFGTNSIRVSDDLGVAWKNAEGIDNSLIDHEWSSVDFTDEGLGVAVSEDAAIAITRDGGRSWKQVTSNLHYKGKVLVPTYELYGPLSYDALRGIRLYKNKGIITGSQRDYLITIPDIQ
jgi:photosystem II stability/assembly factor-like uncharacterized protein